MRLARRRRRKKIRFLMLLFFLCAIAFLALHFLPSSSSPKRALSLSTTFLHPKPTPTPTPTPFLQPNSQTLASAVENQLIGTTGSYAVVVKNLKTGESYQMNGEEQFESGSLYKLWVMAVVYEDISAGFLSENEVLSKNMTELNSEFDVPDDDPEEDETPGVATYPVSNALYQMITISDNDAALLLTDKIGIPSLARFLKTHELTHSQVGVNGAQPVTTADDIALFFNELYTGKLANPQYTQEMINLLKQQKLNEKIPLYLPSSVPVAHKTGEIDGYSHDAGIVYAPNGNYILVELSNSDDPPDAITRIADVSQAVYTYFDPSNSSPE